MQRGSRWKLLLAFVVSVVAAAAPRVLAGDVLSEISVRNTVRPSTFHDEVFAFPGDVRDYSRASFYGWSFRHRLASGATRVLEVSRARTSGAYLLATDLFENGRFSTMSHTVLMVFPRRPLGRSELYALRESATGNLELLAPDGSTILVEEGSGAVLPTATFSVAPLGVPGTPPGLNHRGLHLEIHSVGRSPFLRATPVRIADPFGGSCTLSTDDLFLFGKGPESDVFRFDGDRAFFQFLDDRCPRIRLPADWQSASADVVSPIAPSAGRVTVRSDAGTAERKAWWRGGLFESLLQRFSR